MTPVQLPEVPAPIGHLHSDDDFCRTVPVYPDLWPVDVYTAAQLREYATEAVRLNAIPAVFIEQMEMLREDFQRFANGDPKVPFVVVRDALVQALNEWDEITQPEQNSGR